MRRRQCSLLLLVLLALNGLFVVVAAPAGAAACPTVGTLPARPGVLGPQQALLGVGRTLADEGRLDAAQRLFALASTSTPSDPAARVGLAYVEARRAAAADAARDGQRLAAAGKRADSDACFDTALRLDTANATALAVRDAPVPAATTRAQQAATGWDAFYQGWVDPAVRIGLPALAILAVLFVLARLLTPLAVPASARAWPSRRLRTAWWAGLALLTAASVGAVAVAAWLGGDPRPRIWVAVPVVIAPLALAGALWVLRRSCGAGRWMTSTAGAAVVLGGGAGLVLAVLGVLVPGYVLWWTAAAAAAGLGVVLVAAGRGHPLRLQVTVKRSDGNDPDGTAYVLGRLQELGSSPPQGLKTPQLVDVNDLPSAALSSLPAGRLAAALAPLFQLLTPSTPWRATVEDGLKDELVLVTLTRNGTTAQSALVDPTRFLPRPASGSTAAPETVARGDLLTAAAAVILTELAIRHDWLQEGLCGATRWDSVAAYVVATKPPSSAGGTELRRELLAYAVQADPSNSFAQLAYANLLGEAAVTVEERRAHIQRLETVRGLIDDEAKGRPGYLALRLRTLHTLAAAQLNLGAAETGAARERAAQEAAGMCKAFGELAGRPAPWADRGQHAFVEEMSQIAEQLHLAVEALLETGRSSADRPAPADSSPAPAGPSPAPAGSSSAPADASPAPAGGRRAATPSLQVLFDEACRLALLGVDTKLALDDLEMAAGLEDYRRNALTDPWFARFRRAEGAGIEDQKRFWRIVGAPDPAFTDLPPFGTKGNDLRALGIADARDLLAATTGAAGVGELAKSLEVPPRVAKAWRDLAELADAVETRGGGDPSSVALLCGIGVRSIAELRGAHADDLVRRLDAEAEKQNVRPPTTEEVRSWRAAVRPGGSVRWIQKSGSPDRPTPRRRSAAAQRPRQPVEAADAKPGG